MSTFSMLQTKNFAILKRLTGNGRLLGLVMVFSFLLVAGGTQTATALGSQQNPQNGSVGLEGKVNAPPPTQAATISTPGNGQSVSHIPITVSGLCPSNLLIKVFSNNIFVGSAQCTS